MQDMATYQEAVKYLPGQEISEQAYAAMLTDTAYTLIADKVTEWNYGFALVTFLNGRSV